MSFLFAPFSRLFRTRQQPEANIAKLESFLDMDDSGDPYRSEMQGIFAIIGVVVSVLFGVVCIVLGVCIFAHKGLIRDVVLPSGPWRDSTFSTNLIPYAGLVAILPDARIPSEILSLMLNIIVTICTEAVGFVHSVALKSTLAAEFQLHFNTNLRLITPIRVGHWTHPNGTLCNAAMGLLLTLSYSASSLTFIPVQSLVWNDASSPTWWSTCIFGAPVTILGATILLQALISIISILRVKVLTWSSSPFDTATALIRHGLVIRKFGRSMHSVVDGDAISAPTRERQPSAWQAHSIVKKVVIFWWILSFVCAIWGGIVYAGWRTLPLIGGPWNHGLDSWSLFPNSKSNTIALWSFVDPFHGTTSWPSTFASFAAAQGALTFGLHCAEVNVNIGRDEAQWRRATSTSGMRMSRHPLVAVLGSWPNVALLIAKPVLRACFEAIGHSFLILTLLTTADWIFGLAMNLNATANPMNATLLSIEMIFRTVQVNISHRLGLFETIILTSRCRFGICLWLYSLSHLG